MLLPAYGSVPTPDLLHLATSFVDGNEVKKQLQRLLLAMLASLGVSGCFAFDEIQSGIDIMEEHSPAANSKKAKQPEPESSGDTESKLPELKAQLAKWWRNALEEEPPPPDPNDGIVRCQVHGKLSFMRRSDCEIRGGRLVNK